MTQSTDILRPSDVMMGDVPADQGAGLDLDFSFLRQGTATPQAPAIASAVSAPALATGQSEPASPMPLTAQPQASVDADHAGNADDADELDFTFLRSAPATPPVDDAAIAAQSLAAADRYSSQQIAQARQSAKALGIPFQDALTHGADAARIARQTSMEDIARFSPRLVLALQGRAAYAPREDLAGFNQIATAFENSVYWNEPTPKDQQGQGQQLVATRHSFLERAKIRFEEGGQQVGNALTSSALAVLEGFASASRKDAETNPNMADLLVNDPVQNFVEGLASRIRKNSDEMKAERTPVLADAGTATQRYVENVIQMAPQIVGQVATALMGGAVPSMAFMGAQIMGSSYDDLTQKGVEADTALYASVARMLGQAPLEQLSLNKALAVLKTSGAWNTAKALLGSAATEGVTEFLQAYPDAMGEIWATTTQNGGGLEQGLAEFANRLGQITLDGLYEGAVAAPYGALFGGIGMVRNGKAQADMSADAATEKNAEAGAEFLGMTPEMVQVMRVETEQALTMHQRQGLSAALATAADVVDKSTLQQQDPEAMRELVQDVLPEGYAETWIGADDVAVLYQEATSRGEGENMLATLGMEEQSLTEAIEKGVPIPVATAAVLTQASPQNRAALSDALRVTPDGASGAEAKAYDPATRTEEVLKQIRSTQRMRSEVKTQTTRLAQEIKGLRLESGQRRYTEAQANDFAELHAQQALAFHSAYGVDPAELMRGRSFVGDNAMQEAAQAAVQDGLAQSQMYAKPVMAVSSTLGLAKDASMQEHIAAAKPYHDALIQEMATNPIIHPDLKGAVRFSRKGWNKHKSIAADKKKWQLFPYLREIIGTSRLIESKDIDEGKRKGIFVKAHWLENTVNLDGKEYRVGITLMEDADGNLFYGINPDLDYWGQKYKAGGAKPSEKPNSAPQSPRLGDKNIAEANANVNDGAGITDIDLYQGEAEQGTINLAILEESAGAAPRGVTHLGEQSALVRIFAGGDVSTIPHESMHIFLGDLMRVVADDGTLALNELQRSTSAVLDKVSIGARLNVDEALAAVYSASPAQRGEALHAAALTLKHAREDALHSATLATESAKAMQQEAERLGTIVPPGKFPPWQELGESAGDSRGKASAYKSAENAVRSAIVHLRGLDKARADLATLRRFANVADDADLTPGSADYTTLHETTAKAFEVYLTEGRAPSPKLKPVFARLRTWLTTMYREFTSKFPNLTLNDDVRTVFDRMLATDRDMGQARQIQKTFKAEREFMASGNLYFDEWEELNEMMNQAEAEVQATMDRATLRDRVKRLREYEGEALEDLSSDNFWQTVESLSARTRDDEGNSHGGISKDSVVRLLGKAQAADLARRMPKLINAKAGLPADIAALELGYADEDALINTLYDRLVVQQESKKSLARQMAEKRLESEDAHAVEMGMQSGGEAYATYLDAVDKVTLRIMARAKYRTQREQDRFVNNSIMPRVRIQAQSGQELMSTPLRHIRPDRYQAMLDEAMRERTRALVDGNVVGAVNAVNKARLANDLIWRSRDTLQRAEGVQDLAHKLATAKPGTLPTVQREALRKVLNQFGFTRMRGTPDPEFHHASLNDMLNTLAGDGADGARPVFPSWLVQSRHPKTGETLSQGVMSHRDLTPSDLNHVYDILRYLQKSAYNARTDAKNSEAARTALLTSGAVSAMQSLPDKELAEHDTTKRWAQNTLGGVYGSIDSLRFQMRKADGFSNVDGTGLMGGMEESILSRVLTGEKGIRKRTESINAHMAPHLVHLSNSVQAWEKEHGKKLLVKRSNGKPVLLPAAMQDEYGKYWTADNVIALALNMGNASNMARVRSGYQDLDFETVATLLGDKIASRLFAEQRPNPFARTQHKGLLSAADWQAVQGIWDAIATQWTDTQAVHERMFGFKPQGIDAMPMHITDASGKPVLLSGGYYPVRYDPRLSDRVAQWGEQDDIMARNESVFAVPSAKRGHTKAREDKAPELPVRLDTAVILEHVSDAVRLIEMGEVVRQADKVTRSPAFRAEYIRAFGQADYDALRPNLRGLVRAEPPPRSDILVSMANSVRKYLVPWGLAWNMKVAALQLTALYPAMGDMGVAPVMRGLGYLVTHRMDAMRAIWAVSPYMQSRMDNIDQDLQRNIASFSPSKRPTTITVGNKQIAWDDVVNAGMLPIIAVDAMATGAVWLGAYGKKLAELQGGAVKAGMDPSSAYHQRAVNFADSMVKQSNPDYESSSRSAFLRAQNSYRLVNSFSSAVTLFAARHKFMYTAHAKGKISTARLVRFEAFDTVLPALSMFFLLALARGYATADDDDPKSIFKLLASSLFDFAAMRLPVFGSWLSDGIMTMSGLDDGSPKRMSGLRTALDSPLDMFGILAGRTGKALHQEGDLNDEQLKRLVYGAADIVSFASRVPVSKKIRDMERGYDQWERGEGTPFSLIMPRPGK